jgi:hemerythrin-like domain-containing protein
MPEQHLNDPLQLLCDFHELNGRLCDALDRLVDEAASGCEPSQLRTPANEIHRHFSTIERLHHRDEEEDLFPRLARQTLRLADAVHQARLHHQQIELLWSELGPILRDPAAMVANPDAFAELANRFANLQREHVSFEDAYLIDVARHILTAADQQAILKAMQKRRSMV